MPGYQDTDWTQSHEGHACFDPKKDLVIPGFKAPSHFQHSPLLAHPLKTRDILLYFRGDVGKKREVWYSRGIRQLYYSLSQVHSWKEIHHIFIGDESDIPGDYSEHLSRSKFCLVAPGDGYAMRAEDAVLHGCIPVIVMDGVQAVFESILDWTQFSIRIAEKDIEKTPEILSNISDATLLGMQHALAQVWTRFMYTGSKFYRSELNKTYTENVEKHDEKNSGKDNFKTHPYGLGADMGRRRPFYKKDAMTTIMAWLYSRLPYD
eukprot:gene18362-24833_t